MTVRSALAVRPPRPMTLPRSSGCTRTSSTRPRRSPRLSTWTSSGCSTMPLTRCSRASSSMSGAAICLAGALGGRLGRGLSCRRLSRRRLSRRRLSCRRLGSLRRWLVSRLLGCRLLSCRLLSCRLLSCRLLSCRLLSCRLLSCGLLSCGLLSCGLVGCRRRRLGLGLLGPGRPARGLRLGLGLAVRQRLGDGGSEGRLPVRLRLGRAQRSLTAGQALELLPVARDLEDLPHRVGRLGADGQPVLDALGIYFDERRLGLGVVLADFLDRATIPLGAGVSDDDPVVGRADLAQALQLDLDSHGCGLLPANWCGPIAPSG